MHSTLIRYLNTQNAYSYVSGSNSSHTVVQTDSVTSSSTIYFLHDDGTIGLYFTIYGRIL